VSLAEISIRRPVFAWMLMAAILLFGVISFTRLGVSQLPDVDFPVVQVSCSLPGAAPEVVESQVLDPIEDAIMEIDGIRSVNSTAQQSSGSISVEFELNRDVDEGVQEIQNKINQVRNLMPNSLYPPTVRKSNPEDQPIMWIVLVSKDPNEKPMDLMLYARNTLYDQFTSVAGVANVALGGYVDTALRVWIDVDKLDKFNVTSDDVLQSIYDGHHEIPAGFLSNSKTEYNVRSMGEATTPEEFGQISINQRLKQGPTYSRLVLSQLGAVEESTLDVRRKARFNGVRTVGLGIVKQHGSNAVEVAEAIRERMKTVKALLPEKYQLDIRTDNTRFIKQSVNQLLFVLGLSALLTSLVCFLFLGSWGSTFNILLAIPTSVVGAFTAFYFFHFTLNTFTLLGLSLAIGIVVDDAIMMLENIVRHRHLGEGKIQAAIRGADEIYFAAMSATIAVVAIFLPVVFMQGVIGKFFAQFGLTVTIAVLLSLLEALTLTPMRCSRYLTILPEGQGFGGKIDRVFHRLAAQYAKLLQICLTHRWKTLIVSLIFFASGFWVFKQVPGEMMPPQDQSLLLLRIKCPVGSSMDFTDTKLALAEKYLMDQKEVSGVFAAVGGFGGDAVNQGMIFSTLVPRSERTTSQQELITKFRKALKSEPELKGIEVVVQDLSLRGFAASRGFPVEFIIQGPDWNKLTGLTTQIMDKLKESGFLTDVNTDIQKNMPEVQIIPDRNKLAAHGVALNTVTGVINALIGGAILNGKTLYPKDNHRYAIEARLYAHQRDKVPDLNRIKVRNNRGEVVLMSDLVTVESKPSLMLISRLNRQRAITVFANPAPNTSQQEAMNKTEAIVRSMLPPGYSVQMTGSSKSFKESFQSLGIAMAMGLLVSYLVLASQFNSFIHPITVFMALPFSFTGAFFGLYLFHQSVNMYSFIGFILLMGIVKKNSILLVDYTNQMRAQKSSQPEPGQTPRQARRRWVNESLLEACPIRLRPILMTSVATIAGALPEAMDLGPGSETTIPMSIAIIGGVLASTLLTLFVVPCVYSLLSFLERPETLEEKSSGFAPSVRASH
jgi:HAE1 family hydrophobic/amphiphilic exporter-1